MQKLIKFVTFLSIVVIACSCQKDKENIKGDIKGNWELESHSSAWGSHMYTSGNGNVYTFDVDNYQIFEAGQLRKSGTYKIIELPLPDMPGLTQMREDGYKRIVFDNEYHGRYYFLRIVDKKLYINSDIPGYADAHYIETFTKMD